MYHKTLHIALFGTTEEVTNALRSQAPFRCFEHDFSFYPSFDADAFAQCDIAVIDASAWQVACGSELSPARDLRRSQKRSISVMRIVSGRSSSSLQKSRLLPGKKRTLLHLVVFGRLRSLKQKPLFISEACSRLRKHARIFCSPRIISTRSSIRCPTWCG